MQDVAHEMRNMVKDEYFKAYLLITHISTQSADMNEVREDTHCVYWDDNDREGGHWSEDGCSRMPDEAELTVCRCERQRQLGSFAVLVVRFIKQQQTLIRLEKEM